MAVDAHRLDAVNPAEGAMALRVPISEVEPLDWRELQARLEVALAAGSRVLSFFGRPAGSDVLLTAILEGPSGGMTLARARVRSGSALPSLTPSFPALHIFEREVHESCGLEITGHPWLKPVRYEGRNLRRTRDYPFFKLEGKEVHEVGVGPIHAGVIEPGHFRFMCLGEIVEHLEVQLGYQHRGVTRALTGQPIGRLAPLVELIAGDSSIAYAWSHAAAIEALAGDTVGPEAEGVRAFALELERVAMHLAGLAGLATDIGFLPASSAYGRLRTAAINASMLICGSRFGRGWIRPGGVRMGINRNQGDRLAEILAALKRDLAIVNASFQSAQTVKHRLAGTGRVDSSVAREMGLVGLTARASGIELDVRTRHAPAVYAARPIPTAVEQDGDCAARARMRIREIDASLQWLSAMLRELPLDAPRASPPIVPRVAALSVSVVEGWRGEVVHCIETGPDGTVVDYRVQDPSLRNWIAVALAVRGNGISDFPICNKSFDLSYCGNDL